MDQKEIQILLEKVKSSQISIEDATATLRSLPFEELGFAKLDHHRELRCGFPEVIYCPGKETTHIVEIFRSLVAKGNNVLATRAQESVYQAIIDTKEFPDAKYEPLGKTITLKQSCAATSKGVISIITAGTADLPVAMEAQTTADIMGQETRLICDVGVAGVHRLLDKIELIQSSNVIIVIAGMEGALASVVGGLVRCPVIAVPTSVGYGASFDGLAALLSMLNSCAAGVSVVNIDNGFSAGYNAALINSRTSN